MPNFNDLMNVKIRTQAQPQNGLGRETQVRQYILNRARYDVEDVLSMDY